MKLIKSIIDLRAIVTLISGILFSLGSAFAYVEQHYSAVIEDKVDQSVEVLVDDLIEEFKIKVMEPFYDYASHDLLKQLEKIAKDPNDLKAEDLNKFSDLCQDEYFSEIYVPEQQRVRALIVACNKVLELYDDKLIGITS